MKLFFFFFCIGLLFNSNNANAQFSKDSLSYKTKLICTYKLVFRPDSNSANTISENMILSIGYGISEFRSLNKFTQDSAAKSIVSNSTGVNDPGLGLAITKMLRVPKAKFNYLIFKFYKSNEVTVYDNILEHSYKYKEERYPINWNITNEKTTINDFVCQKATTYFAGRRYIAWFTKEVPISDGPYKFSGLPGLIISTEDERSNYFFSLINIYKPVKDVRILVPTQDAIQTDKRTFIRAAIANRESTADRVDQYGVQNSAAIKARIRETIKRTNNMIELSY